MDLGAKSDRAAESRRANFQLAFKLRRNRNASAFLLTTISASDISMTVPLHIPASPDSSPTSLLRATINAQYKLSLSSYEQLWEWSSSELTSFWSQVWAFSPPLIGTKSDHHEIVDPAAVPGTNPAWFQGAQLNWAENMLRYRTTKTALIETGARYPVQSTVTDAQNSLIFVITPSSRAPARSPCSLSPHYLLPGFISSSC